MDSYIDTLFLYLYIYRTINHPNVLKFLKYIPENQGIIMEYASNGSLERYLSKRSSPIGKYSISLFSFFFFF